MNQFKNTFKVITLALCMAGCAESNDFFKSFSELTNKTAFTYDAEDEQISIDYRLSDATSDQPYSLVPKDGPIIATWNETEVELARVGSGRLQGVMPLSGRNVGNLAITTNLFSSVREGVTQLEILDVPDSPQSTFLDTEIVQLFWNPSNQLSVDSDYLENNTVNILIRELRCGDNPILSFQTLSAMSEYTSENMISTTLSYSSILELIGNSSSTDQSCEVDLSIASTQELVMRTTDEVSDDSESIIISIPDRFANTVSDTHTFTFYSQAVTLTLNR